MMFDLSGRRALVTGASGGIGQAIATALHAQGASVALSGTRAPVLADLAERLGARAHAVPADLAAADGAEQLVKASEAALGGLDILINNAGVGRYVPVAEMSIQDWRDVFDTNMSGVFPLLALPWLIAALPRGRRLRGGLLFLALFVALLAPLNPNCYASRFTIVLLAAFAVLWGLRAGRPPGLVAVLLLAALVANARVLQWRILPEFHAPRAHNARIAAAVGPRTLWLLSGSIGADAHIAGLRADVRFEYVRCPRDGDWTRYFAQIRKTSPWLLLNNNGPKVATGPGSFSALGPPCPESPVGELQQALTAAGWHVAFEEFGYQVWSAEQGREGA